MAVFALMFFFGPPDAYYKGSSQVKAIIWNRQGEVGVGGMLLGMAGGIMAAVSAGGARDMCILQLPGLAVCAYAHFLGTDRGRGSAGAAEVEVGQRGGASGGEAGSARLVAGGGGGGWNKDVITNIIFMAILAYLSLLD